MQHRVVSREEWTRARVALLEDEKKFTALRDALNQRRRELPWVRIDKQYIFDGPDGKITLADLFDGRSQLFIKHFMMGPGPVGQCVGCSLEVDHVEGLLEHLNNHDVTYAAVSRAPISEIQAVRTRMGWRFPWASSFHNDFNFDFHVSFRPEELASGKVYYNFGYTTPGVADASGDSIFYKDEAGQIFHTYSTYGRGGEEFLGIYRMLDLMPKGRNEGDAHTLVHWARPRNMYGKGGTVEPNGRYHAPAASTSPSSPCPCCTPQTSHKSA